MNTPAGDSGLRPESEEVKVHPVQNNRTGYRESSCVPKAVSLAAYEVYCKVYSPQSALIEGSFRGGFRSGELIAFLYARAFPPNEWRKRVDEAFRGMKGLP